MSVNAEDLSRICAGCGLCCNGTLFGLVDVAEDEIERVTKRGLVLHPSLSAAVLPCPKHVEATGCSIYADRPAACHRYSCGVLEAAENGNKSVEQQVDKVRRTIALIDRLKSQGVDVRVVAKDGVAKVREDPASQLDPSKAELLLDLSELKIILKRDYGYGVEK